MAGGEPRLTALRVMACAKVNLSLEVLGKRADGFHEVRTVMQSISLADELLIEPAEVLSLECDLPELEGESNLVIRAARELQLATGLHLGARMVLHKGIPTASGLGGASSDAAASLVGLASLWGRKASLPFSFSVSDRGLGGLAGIASSLGSDVPFFLHGGTALATGRGDLIQPLPNVRPFWLVLLAPPHSLTAKTARMYARLRPQHWTSGERTGRLANALAGGHELSADLLGNSFDGVAGEVFTGLSELRESMTRAGAQAPHLSGAGPALFSIFYAEADARSVAGCLARMGLEPHLARSLSASEARPHPSET